MDKAVTVAHGQAGLHWVGHVGHERGGFRGAPWSNAAIARAGSCKAGERMTCRILTSFAMANHGSTFMHWLRSELMKSLGCTTLMRCMSIRWGLHPVEHGLWAGARPDPATDPLRGHAGRCGDAMA